MKNTFFTALICIISVSALSIVGSAFAEEERPTASLEAGAYSKYIWRGYELSDDSIVIQPSATFGYRGFSMNLWGNLDTELDDMDPSTSDTSEFNETDWTFSYEKSLGPVTMGAGYIYYGLDSILDSEELFVSAGFDLPLAPSIIVYREIAHMPSWYVNLGISHSVPLSEGITLDLGASAGYYKSDDSAFVEFDDSLTATTKKYSGFHDAKLSMAVPIPAGKFFTITPSIGYSFPLTDKAENLIKATSFSNKSDFLFGGVSFSLAF